MKTPVRWTGRCLSLLLMSMIISACSQTPTPPSNTSDAVSEKPLGQSTSELTQTKPPTQVDEAQDSPAPTIATLQTQQRTAGFAENGQYFIYLESWRDQGAGIPHAAIQIMNLPTNTCVTNGCLRTRFNESQAEQSIAAAENNLLTQTQQVRQDLNLTSPLPGKPLPVLARSRTADGTETLTVRLQNNQPLQLTLKQKRVVSSMSGGTAEKDQAAMQLEVRYGGKTRSLGSLNQMHDWVMDFSVREVQQSPDGKTVAILVTAAERAFEGSLGRTMVQGLAL